MLPTLLFFALTTAQAICISDFSLNKSSSINTTNCKCYYEGIPYTRREIFAIKSGLPTNLAFDPVMKDLYFTLIDVESLENTQQYTKLSQYVLKVERKCRGGKITLINYDDGQAAAYDELNKVVYLATTHGLQTIDETYKPKFHSYKKEDIVQLFKGKKNYMYAVLHPDSYVYKISLDKNEKRKVLNLPCAYILAVDNDDNIYFVCEKRIAQVLLKGLQEPIDFIGVPKNTARAITADAKGRIILATTDGLYHLTPNNIIPKKLMNLDISPSGIAIHKEDIYISTNKAIYLYTPCL